SISIRILQLGHDLQVFIKDYHLLIRPISVLVGLVRWYGYTDIWYADTYQHFKNEEQEGEEEGTMEKEEEGGG
ncbi:unnamed protein product, partial [Musa hybrid cultivar]